MSTCGTCAHWRRIEWIDTSVGQCVRREQGFDEDAPSCQQYVEQMELWVESRRANMEPE